MNPLAAFLLTLAGTLPSTQEGWIAATDEAAVRRSRTWTPVRHRYAAAEALATQIGVASGRTPRPGARPPPSRAA